MSGKCFVISDINMALTTQIVMVCTALSLSSAQFLFKNHHHRPENDMEDFPKLLTEMFHPRNPMQGLFQINPINHPGILGFQSFGRDFNGGMLGQGPGGYGTEDSMPSTPSSFEREDENSQRPVYDEQGRDPNIRTGPQEGEFGDQLNNNNNENDQNKPDDTDISNNDKEPEKLNSVDKEEDDKMKVIPSETDSALETKKNKSDDTLVSKHKELGTIVFPDSVNQAKDRISKESSYYGNPQPSNGYVSSPVPQIIYAVSVAPSGTSSNPAPYVPTTVQSNPSQTTINTVQSYPSTNNINVQNPQPQYQTNGNSPTSNVVPNNPNPNPGYNLVTLPNNGASSNTPVYYTNNPPVSNPPQNTNYQPLTTGQQYYLVSMNGQNVLVPVNNVQTGPNQPNSNNQINLIPVNAPSNYVPVNNPNVPPSTPQNNGQVHYIAVQLVPQNNNQVSYVPANQGISQTPAQTTPQGSVNYVPVNSQPTIQNPPPNNNQVTYVPANQGIIQTPAQNTDQGSVKYVPVNYPPQNNNQVTYVPVTVNQGTVQTPTQGSVNYVPVNSQSNPPQNNNEVRYVPANPAQVVQIAPNTPQSNNQVNYVPANTPTNSGQVSYVPLNTQNPQGTAQYNLVPINTQNTGQSNLVKLVPATLTSSGNVPLLVFKEKAKLSSKDKKKHKEEN